MGGHSAPETPKVPDWRTYRVEDVPELMAVRKALATHNLRDPWLRNYVWMYTESIHKKNINRSIFSQLSSGFKLGLVAAIVTALAEKAFFSFYHRNDSNDSHH